jgi:hypothetical protein
MWSSQPCFLGNWITSLGQKIFRRKKINDLCLDGFGLNQPPHFHHINLNRFGLEIGWPWKAGRVKTSATVLRRFVNLTFGKKTFFPDWERELTSVKSQGQHYLLRNFWARVFAPGRLFQLSLMFVVKARRSHLRGQLKGASIGLATALLAHIGVFWKGLPETSILACWSHS